MHQQDHFYKYNWALLQRLTQLHLELIGKIPKTELHALCKFKSFLLNHKRRIINSEPAERLWQTAAAPVTTFRNQIKEDFWFSCRYPSQLHRVGNKLKKNKYRITNNTLHLASLTFLYTHISNSFFFLWVALLKTKFQNLWTPQSEACRTRMKNTKSKIGQSCTAAL